MQLLRQTCTPKPPGAEHLHSFGEHDASPQNHLQHSDKYFAIKVVPVHFRFALHRHKPFNPMLLKHMLFKQGNLLVVCALAGLSGIFAQKRGFLFPWDSVAADLSASSFTRAGCPEVVSYIDWESWTFGTADPSFEFIAVARTQSDVAALETYLPTDRADKIAFLNEPDLPGSTQLDVATAVQIWQQTIVPYRTNNHLQLLSPAVTSNEATGLPWLAQFMAAVSEKPDYIALHYYGTDATAFETYVTMVYQLYGLPIYITEVSSTASDLDSVTSFMTSITAWCDQQSWIAGVFWFAASRTANIQANLPLAALMNSDGTRTALGDLYCTG